MTVAYVGQLGTHLVVPHEANNPVAGVGPVGSWINANDRRPLASSLPNVGNIALTESSARMSYNSLQFSARHRLSGGLEVTGFYVWSKSMMENLGYYGCGSVNSEGAYWQDAYNRRGNRGPSCFDAQHNASFGGLYNLPFGKGQEFGSNANKAVDLLPGRLECQFLYQPAFRFSGHRVCHLEQWRQDATRQPARQRLQTICNLDPDCGRLLRSRYCGEFLRLGRGRWHVRFRKTSGWSTG